MPTADEGYGAWPTPFLHAPRARRLLEICLVGLLVTVPAWIGRSTLADPSGPGPSAPDSPPAPAEAPAGGKLDLHLKLPRAATGVEGEWVYQPLDGSEPYRITLRATQGGFYEYEGRREGVPKPVLQMDRGTERMLYRGEIGERFDPCIPAGARFSLYPTVDALIFEPSMPVMTAVFESTPGPCTEARVYLLAAKGKGDEVKLRTQSDIVGNLSPQEVQPPPDGRFPGKDQPSSNEQKAGATLTVGVPSAPDGARVLLLGSLRDATGKLWHHVRLVENPAEDASATGGEPGAPGTDKAASGENDAAGKAQGKSLSGAKAGGGAPTAPDANDHGGSSAKGAKGEKTPSGPRSGYVAADNVIMRWQCRMNRATAQ